MPEGQLIWLFPGRVIIVDETCVNGGILRTKNRGPKVIGAKSNREPRTKTVRRVEQRHNQNHVSLLAGQNLLGQPTPPGIVVSRKGKLSKSGFAAVRAAIVAGGGTSEDLRAIGALKYTDVIVGTSPKGGVVKDNIYEILVGIIKMAYPNVSDESAQTRVILFIDCHGSRFMALFLRKLKKQGIYLFFWLPNCTSLMQAPDKVLFGILKTILDKLRRDYGSTKSIDECKAIELAITALVKAGTPATYAKGARLTGIEPWSRDIHLESSACRAGDKLRAEVDESLCEETVIDAQESRPIAPGGLSHTSSAGAAAAASSASTPAASSSAAAAASPSPRDDVASSMSTSSFWSSVSSHRQQLGHPISEEGRHGYARSGQPVEMLEGDLVELKSDALQLKDALNLWLSQVDMVAEDGIRAAVMNINVDEEAKLEALKQQMAQVKQRSDEDRTAVTAKNHKEAAEARARLATEGTAVDSALAEVQSMEARGVRHNDILQLTQMKTWVGRLQRAPRGRYGMATSQDIVERLGMSLYESPNTRGSPLKRKWNTR
jgi:hypothetical protein